MIYRLTDLIKNSINNFLSQELSPDEIEEMRLNEGLRLEDVKQENMADILEFLQPQQNNPASISNNDIFVALEDEFNPINAYDFDFMNPYNDW